MIGTRLNHYEIVGRLGTGGMGEVYAADDTKLNRRIAVKILPEDLAADPERRSRFEREAQAVAALNHPNIVTIYSVEEADGLHFITMELVEGKPLGELIPAGGMSLDEFFKLSVPLVDALDAAHKKGITHRDLKPGNVMVTDEGRVKVLDFGLAKLTGTEAPLDPAEAATMVAGSDLTEQGQILGTVAYMSPEQAQGKPVDHRSDIFSLGVLLYEMATGKAPFQGDTKISVITSIMRDTPPPVSEINVELPQHLGRVVNRSLAKTPDRRFQSTTDLRNELEDLKVEIETSQLRDSAVRVAAPSRPGERKLVYAVAGAAMLVAVVVLGIMFGPRGGGSRPAPTVVTDGTPSLAVLYFDNLSGNESLDWLRTGLTDMLVTDLSQSPNLRVLGTDRVYQILSDMGRADDAMTSADIVEAVAREGNVSNVLLGSFATAGNTIRISARVQEAGSGEILGSETVEGVGEESIFSLVDDLTRRIKSRFTMAGAARVADVDADLTDVTTDSVEAYRFYAEGIALHEQLKEAEAIPLLEKAIEVDPDFAMAQAKLAVAYENIGEIDKAREFSERAMENIARVNDRERYYIEGRHYSLDGDTIEDSIAAYQKALEAYPDHTSARNNLAQQLMELERYDEAIVHLEELRRRGMRFPGTYASLATAYGVQGRFDEGLEVLREYTRQNPANAAGVRNLAGQLIWAERHDEALDALERAESLGLPANQAAGFRWQVYALRGDFDAARGTVDVLDESASALDRAQAAFGIASAELLEGDLDEAVDALEEIAAPGAPLADQALNYLGAIKIAVGDWDGAIDVADRMLAAGEEDVNSRINGLGHRAAVLAGRGDRAGAEAAVEEVLTFVRGLGMPQRVIDRQEPGLRATVAFYSGDWQRVVALLEPLLARLPPRPQRSDAERTRLQYVLGAARYELGDLAGAEGAFRDAIRHTGRVYDPIPFVRSLYQLGQVLEDGGDDAGAERFYRRFLEHWEDGEIDEDRVERAEAFVDAR